MCFSHCKQLGVWLVIATFSQQGVVYRARWLLSHTSDPAEGLN